MKNELLEIIDIIEKGGKGSGVKGHTTWREWKGRIPKDHPHYDEALKEMTQAQEEGKSKEAFFIWNKHVSPTAAEHDDDTHLQNLGQLDHKKHIGMTRTGKPIPLHAKETNELEYDVHDHQDAMEHHFNHVQTIHNKINDFRDKNPESQVPQPVLDTLNHHYDQSKRHQELFIKLGKVKEQRNPVKKSVNLQDHEETNIETADFAQEYRNATTFDLSWLEKIKVAMKGYKYGDSPVEIPLSYPYMLSLVRVSQGLYSGFVTNLEEKDNIRNARIARMTIPTMLSYLRSLELIEANDRAQKEEAKELVVDMTEKLEKEPEIVEEGPNLIVRNKVLDIIDKLLTY